MNDLKIIHLLWTNEDCHVPNQSGPPKPPTVHRHAPKGDTSKNWCIPRGKKVFRSIVSCLGYIDARGSSSSIVRRRRVKTPRPSRVCCVDGHLKNIKSNGGRITTTSGFVRRTPIFLRVFPRLVSVNRYSESESLVIVLSVNLSAHQSRSQHFLFRGFHVF